MSFYITSNRRFEDKIVHNKLRKMQPKRKETWQSSSEYDPDHIITDYAL